MIPRHYKIICELPHLPGRWGSDTVADKCYPSNFNFPNSCHFPFCTSTFQINMFAIMRCARSDDATAHQRIVDNGGTQKNTCAEPWGCWCGYQPDCAANLLVDILPIWGIRWGVATVVEIGRMALVGHRTLKCFSCPLSPLLTCTFLHPYPTC